MKKTGKVRLGHVDSIYVCVCAYVIVEAKTGLCRVKENVSLLSAMLSGPD